MMQRHARVENCVLNWRVEVNQSCLDLQIALIALANGVTLVTHNTDEFSRVASLLLEDWEL